MSLICGTKLGDSTPGFSLARLGMEYYWYSISWAPSLATLFAGHRKGAQTNLFNPVDVLAQTPFQENTDLQQHLIRSIEKEATGNDGLVLVNPLLHIRKGVIRLTGPPDFKDEDYFV
ncbi:hypothetical protein H6P81_010851 [Aristolochia fimbriata]|uniref:Uncharacterized protein n=1 Tax=Aristolochia fimbriata TaxID=158543 RepID=A0AAV7ETE7_ARIFI|nr:hypothetical protein H6P81_010851 [Aristolochia fimbriata]